MKPTGAKDAADAAFDTWLWTGLHARYDAAAAAPVPRSLVRLAQGHRGASRAAPAAPPRSRDTEDGDPALGLAIAVASSGLFWTAVALAVRALWG